MCPISMAEISVLGQLTVSVTADSSDKDAKDNEEAKIKKEVEDKVKPEPQECIVCSNRSHDVYDVYVTCTTVSGTSLFDFLCKFTHSHIAHTGNNLRHICKTCYDLINGLEQAEFEYVKVKQAFEDIISKNPLFSTQSNPQIDFGTIKTEINVTYEGADNHDSEDEPLAVTKKKRGHKIEKKKKKLSTSTMNMGKRKIRSKSAKDSWECDLCGMQGIGGAMSEAAHKVAIHTFEETNSNVVVVKKESSPEGSQSSHYNGFDTNSESLFKMEFDDDDSSTYVPDNMSNGDRQEFKKVKGRRGRPPGSKNMSLMKRRKKSKDVYQCSECDAKYTSLSRLEHHKAKHSSKPPYICEVCGAHYKHKRACDIHVALHKGISDWKCEECDRLFPSKGALQRHNNIHTGKANYQCDLCGKSFIHTSSFKMHKLSHSGVKPHACDVCGLALMTRSHLKRHKRVHSGEKRHECHACGKRFSERYNLVAHSRAHDAVSGAAGAAGAPGAPGGPAERPRRRLFRCPFCQEGFERRYMLERHVVNAHGRTLERPPATPRNTMSKLLKAQAQRRDPPPPAPPAHTPDHDVDSKDDLGSVNSTPTKTTVSQSGGNGSGSSSGVASMGAWAGAYGAADIHHYHH